jgi:hypothetical protein
MQEAALETLEYSPAAHAVHVVAPVAEPVPTIHHIFLASSWPPAQVFTPTCWHQPICSQTELLPAAEQRLPRSSPRPTAAAALPARPTCACARAATRLLLCLETKGRRAWPARHCLPVGAHSRGEDRGGALGGAQ